MKKLELSHKLELSNKLQVHHIDIGCTEVVQLLEFAGCKTFIYVN